MDSGAARSTQSDDNRTFALLCFYTPTLAPILIRLPSLAPLHISLLFSLDGRSGGDETKRAREDWKPGFFLYSSLGTLHA